MAFEEAINLGNKLSNLFDKGWKKKIQPASFRGVPFYVSKSKLEIGRRTKVYEPTETSKKWKNYKKTIIQDIGQKSNKFVVTGYIVQANRNEFDYMTDRDKLIEALVKKGEGKLVHPFYGAKSCALFDAVEMEESFDEGGICRFTIPFVEATLVKRFPKKKSAKGWLDKIANSSILKSLDDFATKFNGGLSYANSLVSAVVGVTQGVLAAVNGVVGTLSSTVNFVVNSITTLSTLVQSVLNSPCAIADAYSDMFDKISTLGGMNGDVFLGGILKGCQDPGGSGFSAGQDSTTEQYSDATGRDSGGQLLTGENIPQALGASLIDAYTTVSEGFDETDMAEIPAEQEANVRSMIDLVKALPLMYATKVAVRVDFESKESLEDMVNKMIAAFDALILRLGDQSYIQPVNQILENVNADPDSYRRENTGSEELLDLTITMRATFITAMELRKDELAAEVDYIVPDGGIVPALVLAYDQYDDANRDLEIIKRNAKRVSNPAFLSAGETMNLLGE